MCCATVSAFDGRCAGFNGVRLDDLAIIFNNLGVDLNGACSDAVVYSSGLIAAFGLCVVGSRLVGLALFKDLSVIFKGVCCVSCICRSNSNNNGLHHLMAGRVFCVSAIADASVIPAGIDSLMVGGLHVALALPPQKQGEEQFHCLRLSFREDTATEHLVVSLLMGHHDHCQHFSLSQGVHALGYYSF